jgi:hypothetical protein
MSRHTPVCAAFLALSLMTLPAPGAVARPMDGRFGVGLERTLGGATGLGLRFFAADVLAIAATVGVDIAIVDEGEDTSTSAGVTASVGALFQVARSDHAHLSVGARLTLGYRSLDAFRLIDPDATSSDLDLAFELPIGLEVWLADHFSVVVSTGLIVDIVPSSGAQVRGDGAGSNAPPGSIGVGIGAGSITATLGAFYYF